jgi:hypothetical protein
VNVDFAVGVGIGVGVGALSSARGRPVFNASRTRAGILRFCHMLGSHDLMWYTYKMHIDMRNICTHKNTVNTHT